MPLISMSKPVKATWLGRAGTVIDYHFDRKRVGKRICVLTWADDGSHTIRAIEGDGRYIDSQIFEELVLSSLSEAELIEIVNSMALRHFN